MMNKDEIKEFLESETLPVNPDGSVDYIIEIPPENIKWHPDYITKVIS